MKKFILVALCVVMLASSAIGITAIIKNNKDKNIQKPTYSSTFSSKQSSLQSANEGFSEENGQTTSISLGSESSTTSSAESFSSESCSLSDAQSSSGEEFSSEGSSYVEDSSSSEQVSSSQEPSLSAEEKAILVKEAVFSNLPETVDSTGGGSVELIESALHTEQIYWSSNTPLFTEKGVYRSVIADFEVTLTASFTVDNQEFSFDFNLTLKAATQDYPTITQVLNAASASGESSYLVDEVLCYIVGFVPAHQWNGEINGIYLTDGKALATLTTADGQLIKDGNFYYLNGVKLKVGMGIYLKELLCFGNSFECVESTSGRVDTQDNPIDYLSYDSYLTVDSRQTFGAFMQNITSLSSGAQVNHMVIKFVATKDNPILFTGVNDRYFINFYYSSGNNPTISDQKIEIGDKDGTLAYSGSHSISFALNVGKTWVEDNTRIVFGENYEINDFSETAKATKFVGEFYAVFEYMGSSQFPYAYFGILSTFNLSKLN